MSLDADDRHDSSPRLDKARLCSHHLFEHQARRTPDATAATFEGRSLTYRELEKRSNRLANHLRALGVGPDKLVGLCVERSLETAIGLLGILKAGGAYVPIDPAYPQARIGQILRASKAEVLVTQRSLAEALPAHQAREVYLGEGDDALDASDADPAVAMRSDALGYVIYTSGSTGEPKGVCLPHAALVNLILWHDRTLLRGARTLQFASLSFDASFHEMFAAWCSGGTVFFITEATRHDVAALIRFIERERIEKVTLPVVVVQQMAEIAGDEPHRFRSLRELTTTGEQLHITAPVRRLFEKLPGCAFHNHYGPSETHVVTAYTMSGDPSSWEAHPPIGWAIDNTTMLVLDDRGRPTPIGEVGELYIGGIMLARGYLHRPDLTAERFLPNPLSTEPGARLYWTGDLARVRDDGCIEFLGRIDHQVKIRGFRVELGEIEATLDRFPGVKSTAVLAREDTPGDKRLVAYVVADAGAAEAEKSRSLIADLRVHARERLPDFMVPSAFVLLDRMPLTQNGKVDRRALPAPGKTRPAMAQTFVAPRPGVEARLAAIWEEVLRLGPVGARDDFFELGGHSIHAVQVASRVRRAFGIEVAFQQIFEGSTVAELSALIEGARGEGSRADPIGKRDRRLPLPLSLAQERLWFLQRLAPESTAYSCPYFFHLTGKLVAAALEKALGEMVRRHEVLRILIAETRVGVAARIGPGDAFHMAVTDLRHLAASERRDEARRILDAEAGRPFDLRREPPLRAGLIRLGETEHALWLNLHHIVTDGRSMEVLFSELSALYMSFASNAAPALREPGLQFADYAAWQRERLGARALHDLAAWWKSYLEGAPALLDLPADHPRPAVQSFRGATVPFRVDRGLTERLRAIAARRKMTLTMVMLAAFAVELHRYTGREDILIGVPTLGRDRVDLEEVVGFFVNTLPIRIRFSGDPSVNEVLNRVREASLSAYEHDALPFHQLVQELHPERALSHNPLVQVGFAPQPPGEHELRLDGLDVRPLEANAQKTTLDLTMFLWEGADGIACEFEMSTDLFERPTIERMAAHLLAILDGFAADPKRRVSALPLVSGEGERLALEQSSTPAAPPKHACIHDLVEAHAARAPEAEAVVFGATSIAYGELDRRANQVARALQKRGVGPETLVGLCIERSIEMVVGLLGILKAGGAYVPLDPTYPIDRLAFMIEDSGLSVLVTRSSELDRLPPFSGSIVRLDEGDRAIAAESGAPLPPMAGPENAAYAIYTSGSTGRPKGVVVEHRSAAHLAAALDQELQLSPEARILQLSSLGFDASVFDLLLAWVSGATLVLAPPRLLPGPELSRVLREQRASVLALSPSALAQQPFEPFPDLTTLVVGGEACPAALVDRWAPGRRFINGYGPTEATVGATLGVCEAGLGAPSIGRPIAGARAYLLDAGGQLVPPGVVGELFIGGTGVARGYLNRPSLTSDRFVPDPFSGEPGARMYRTGDLARRRSDGRLEFVGRLDQQVKIRGFRVELGEIEEALREHPAVREVAVVARKDARAGTHLVAYVVEAGDDGPLENEHIAERQTLYNTTYRQPPAAEVDPTLDTTGWNSSFTGEPIGAGEMRAWRDAIVHRILERRPERVWEIGCGTGLLLFQVAPRCAEYVGTDLSEAVIERLRPIAEARGLSHVSLEPREAIDFREADRDRFDLVVLSSTVQYFPDARYLRRVLEGAARAVRTGGAILVGDVRSLPLLDAFHTAVELCRAPEDTPAEALRERVQAAIAAEPELVIAPDFFRALSAEDARIAHAEILLKRGRGSDEMTRFRYDVWLFVGESPEPVRVSASHHFTEIGGDLASLERRLSGEPAEAIEILAIPNGRVGVDRATSERLQRGFETTATTTTMLSVEAGRAIEPEDLWELGERLGFDVRVTFSSTDPGLVDALFEKPSDAARPRPWMRPMTGSAHLVNDPLARRRSPRIGPALRAFLRGRLPDFMIPSAFVALNKLPLTPNGKVDRRALPAPARRRPSPMPAGGAPGSPIEQALAEIWREVLDLDRVGLDEGFFDLGGHSLLLTRVRAAIAERLGREVPMTDLFRHPTIRRLASHLGALENPENARQTERPPATPATGTAIAIIGMAGRFPGADNVDELWENLRAGIESITFSTPEELEAAGVDPALIRSPSFVPAMGILRDSMAFDAAFFGYSPNEARLMDPQHRVFLEVAFSALESAGYAPPIKHARVGVFGGTDSPRYWLERLGPLSAPLSAEEYQVGLGNISDTLTSRVAYKLGLRGPALTILSACSTSLVAVHLASRSLLAGECEMALAGASVVLPPDRLGHLAEDGSIASPDGHCRPFDAQAQGTVGASGAALVVLKRLEDALADGDTIHAVIRGSAINNDGQMKVGFMAPGLDGQAEVIARAQAIAGVHPESISFVEGHGTATRLGDPVEVAALTQAFRRRTAKRGFCALGSLKSNVGHMGATAGIGGLIKATLSLAREMIPPTIHFQSPNPECRLAESPFFVNAEPLPWKRGDIPRRAGVSSFGVGGTNAHLVLEEAPALEPTRSTQTCQILPQSARTTAALDTNSNNLCARLEADPELCLADAAFTLQTGRAAFKHRRAVVARDSASARAALRTRDPAFVFEGIAGSPKVVFMFPGGGTQEPGMGRALYETEPVYRATLDACAALFEAELGVDIRSALFAAEGAEAAEVLRQPLLNLPAIFATEVALTKLFLAWGITPSALIGHSLGEYTAACIAGVLSQEDAVALVALRARLYADLPGGAATLLVPLSEASIAPRLPNGVSLAAVNGPENCVVSGVAEAIKGFEAELLREGIEVRRLALTTAAHSPLLKPVAERLTERATLMNLRSCCIPLVSNVTGTWLRDAESRDPSHWARHLCSPVRFADGIATLLADPDHVFVEVGPGRTLSSLTARQPRSGSARLITTSMAAAGSARTDVEAALGAAARLWCAGAPIHFEALHQGERRRRIPLPTYPFERTRYVIERAPRARTGSWTARTTPRRTPPTSTKEPRPSRPSIPMSPAEQALAGIWRELLGVEVLRPDDNFFDLGGDSLLAVRLRTKIRERFGVPLALHDLVESPTVGALAKRLHDQAQDLSFEGDPPVSSARAIGLSRRGAPPEGRLCVKLEEGDPRIRPLFLVQPLGGTVFTYLPLARALGGGIPVYGVRASGMEEGEPILNDVPAMASRYLEEIRALQPEGPFAIGGHSAGGVIAFEMARQLEAEGEEPGLVILLDALGPPKRVRSREDLLRELTSFRDIAPEAYRGLVAALRTDAALGSIMLAMSEALANYEACPIETEIAYIRAREDREPGDLHAEQAWMDRAKGAFTLHNVLGNHFTMMEPPNIAAVARVVRQHLMTLGPVRLEATAANG